MASCGDFDSEEREFICEYFSQLSQIVSVDIADKLNGWLYGKGLNTLLKVMSLFKAKEKVVETLTQECTGCSSKLETFIVQKQEGIPDYAWTIIKCKSCSEYNLLSVGPNVKQYRFGEYTPDENLPKAEYTEEKARLRLEQIKYFRKK